MNGLKQVRSFPQVAPVIMDGQGMPYLTLNLEVALNQRRPPFNGGTNPVEMI